MTWNELNERSNGALEAFGTWKSLEVDLDESGYTLNDQVVACLATDWLLEVLKEYDFAPNEEAEYLENQMLINELEKVR